MIYKALKRILPIVLSVMLLMTALPVHISVSAAATTVNVLDGQVSVTDSVGNGSLSNGTVTITAKGSLFSKTTNTVTIANETANRATLSFDYTATSANSFKIAGATANASGTYSVLLDAGATLTIVITSNSGISNLTATLKLSNFSLIKAADSSNVTVEFDSALGSVTVDGAAVSSGDTIEDIKSGTSLTLAATPNSGTEFYGWIDTATGEVLSSNASYTYEPTADATIKPVFIGSGSPLYFMISTTTEKTFRSGLLYLTKNTYYTVDSATHIFDNFAAATSTAAATTSKVIVPLNDGTIPSGDYTIPSGVTLLIPFDDANTMYTNNVEAREYKDTDTYKEPFVKPTPYCNITLASGVNITVNGSLNLSAKQIVVNGGKVSGGSPVDSVSMLVMEEDSSITVNSGGKLYAYGFITGNGTVTAKNNSDVYECFQIMDFRGGTQATDMENRVFPISQYYIQNIEVPLTLEYGSREHSYTNVRMLDSNFGSAVEFIGPDSSSMFNLTQGSVTKTYDGATDRLIIELNGKMVMRPVSLKVGTETLDSEDYVLAVNNNITINVNEESEITINQDIALLPGTEMYIDEGATATLGSGKKVYVYDAAEWGNFVYSAANKPFAPVEYAPGRTYTRTAANLVDAKIQVDGTVDASAGFVYTTKGGANIYSTGTGTAKTQKGTETVTYQLVQGTGYSQIPITPARLKNADGTYLETGSSSTESNTYTYTNGKWVCSTHTYEIKEEVEPTCTENGHTTYECKVCKNSYDEVKTATGHKAGADATCTTAQTCTICGTELTAAKGHSYGEFTVKTAPTHSEEGCKTATCSGCGDEKTEIIPKIVCDINGDGITGKAENVKLKLFMLDVREPSDEEFALFDMNDDGYINVVDYAIMYNILKANGIL